jgi:hypothetical protein
MPPEDAAAVAIPAADQPPPAVTKDVPFAQRWAAVADQITDDAEESAETPPEAQPQKAAPKKDAKAPGDSKEAKRAQLKTLAEDLGLNVDDSAVSVAERAEHRAAMRRDKEKLAAERAEFEKTKALKPEQHAAAEFGTKLRDAYERGDPDGFAKALGAKDFNDFQTNFIKRVADPNYVELQRMQRKLEEKEAAEKQAQEETQRRAQNEDNARRKVAYMTSLTDTCQKSANPMVQAFADHPLFLETVFKIQQENWDPEEQKTVTVEQAIKKALRGASQDLEAELRDFYERGKKAFEIGSAAPAAAVKTNGKKPAPKTAVVPVSSNGGGGPPKKPSDMSPQEWAKYRAARFAEAED